MNTELFTGNHVVTDTQVQRLLVAETEEIRNAETQEPYAGFKARVALEAGEGERTVSKLAARYGVHPTMIHLRVDF